MLSCTVIFNGNSLTFLGMLASLVAICLIWDKKTNFVTGIIEERCSAIWNEWDILSSKVNYHEGKQWDRYNNLLRKISELKEYSQKIKEGRADNRTGMDDTELQNKVDELTSLTTMAWNGIIASYQHDFVEPIKKRIDHIKDANKSVTSAIFSLFICVWAFVMNESVTVWPSFEKYAVSSLFGIIVCSSVFWLVMWLSFIIRAISLKKPDPTLNPAIKNRRPPLFMKGAIGLVLPWGLAWLSYAAMIPYPAVQFWLGYVVGCILPIIGMAVLQYRYRHHYVTLAYSFAINHFIAFLFLSSIWSLWLCLNAAFWNPRFAYYFMPYNSLTPLMLSLETFVLVVGLILPVFVPYLATYIIAWKMQGLNNGIIDSIAANDELYVCEAGTNDLFASIA